MTDRLLCPKRAWTPSPLNRAVLILHSSPGNQGCCWRNNTSFASKGADVTVAQSENGPKPVAFLKRWKQPFQPDGEEQQWLRDAPLNVQKQKAASLEASSGVNLVLKPEDGKPKVIQGHEMYRGVYSLTSHFKPIFATEYNPQVSRPEPWRRTWTVNRSAMMFSCCVFISMSSSSFRSHSWQ
eukprot:m.339550 g.339550  ORF g.339550 m.339550 type:complete len:182 (-) comp16542_c1_seq33:2584-3129(-)